jgi:hypothetical protein
VHALRYPRQWEIDIRLIKPVMLMPDIWIYEGYRSQEEASIAIPDLAEHIESGMWSPGQMHGELKNSGPQVSASDEPRSRWSMRFDNRSGGPTWIRRNGWLLSFLAGSAFLGTAGGITGLGDPNANHYLAGGELAIGVVMFAVTVRVFIRGVRR